MDWIKYFAIDIDEHSLKINEVVYILYEKHICFHTCKIKCSDDNDSSSSNSDSNIIGPAYNAVLYKFHKNGRIKNITNFICGIQQGARYNWHNNGSLENIEYYSNNKLQTREYQWDMNSKLWIVENHIFF